MTMLECTTKRPQESYEDHLWYPIVVRMNGRSVIREISGAEMNLWRAYIGSVQDVVIEGG